MAFYTKIKFEIVNQKKKLQYFLFIEKLGKYFLMVHHMT